MINFSKDFAAAIAEAEELLGGNEVVLFPPHMGGNDTKLTLVLTAGEVEMAKALHGASESLNAEFGVEIWPEALRKFAKKMGGLGHD